MFVATRALGQLGHHFFQERRFQRVVAFGDHRAQQVAHRRNEGEQGDNDGEGGAVLGFSGGVIAAAGQHPADQRAAQRQPQLEHKQGTGEADAGQAFAVTPFAVVDGVGHHYPLDWRHQLVQYANDEDKDKHGDFGVHRYEEHRHAEHRQEGVGPPEDADFAFPVGQRFRQRRANQVADAVGREEGGEQRRRAHDPGGVIHHRAAANADREDIEDGEHADHPPLVIAPDIAQVFTHRGTARRRFDTLFGGKEAEGQHQEGNHRQHRDAPLEAERFVFAADKVDQRHHQHGGEHAPRRRQHEAPGLQRDALRRVVGDHAAQRAVRDIHHGVEQGQQRVGHGGVDQLAVVA